MNRKTVALVLAVLAVAGCTLNRSERPRETVMTVGGNGRVIEPKRCGLQVAILSRTLRDKGLNAVWSEADVQAVPAEARRALEANGLRIGLISGDLPAQTDAILKAPPPRQVDPSNFDLPDGTHAMISLCESMPTASLLLSREGRAFGKDYHDASGWLRVTATQEGETGVALRFVPEIHHGPVQTSFNALPNAGNLAPQEFMREVGQQKDCLRDLSATLTVQPGQVIVVGGPAEPDRSLGSFLFTRPEANSDQLNQKIVLIWASRTSVGAGAGEPGGAPSAPKGLLPVDPPEMAAKGER